MAYLGREAAKAALVTADIPDDSITSAKIVDATIAAGDLAANSVDSSELVDGSIDTIHVGDNQITLAKLAGGTDGNIISYDASGDPVAIATGDDGEVLTSAGVGQPPAFEAASGGGITEADLWRTTSNGNGDLDPVVNWERADTNGAGKLGTGMTESSGVFTFPSTGLWFVKFEASFFRNGSSRWNLFDMHWSTNSGGAWALTATGNAFIIQTDGGNTYNSASCNQILDVTDVGVQRVKFKVEYAVSTNSYLLGDSNQNQTHVTFIRLGDT